MFDLSGWISLNHRAWRHRRERPDQMETFEEWLHAYSRALIREYEQVRSITDPGVSGDIMAAFAAQQVRLDMVDRTMDDVLATVRDTRGKVESLIAYTSGLRDKVTAALAGSLTANQQQALNSVFDEAAVTGTEAMSAIEATPNPSATPTPVPDAPSPA